MYGFGVQGKRVTIMRKIRVLFNISGQDTWIGGIYYLRNIIYQVSVNPLLRGRCIPVIVCSIKYSSLFLPFGDFASIITYDEKRKTQRVLALLKGVQQADLIYNYHPNKLDPLGILEKKAIYWIPDFQDLHYPGYFSNQQLESRRQRAEAIGKSTSPLVLSSQSCRDDFLSVYQKARKDIYIVPFVSAIEDEIRQIESSFIHDILDKRKIPCKGFYLVSNQFWQHKNHVVVFHAIAELKKRGVNVCFVFTGALQDSRNKEFYTFLQRTIKETGVESNTIILGFISRKEQLALMMASKAVVQPSLFEGWGTVVEDAKVMDKTILLSDIPVHREQMNDKCILFDPHDPIALADIIENTNKSEQHDDVEKGIADMHVRAQQYSKEIIRLLDSVV